MIIAAALDPASLTMWSDPSLFNRGPTGSLNVNITKYAISNDFDQIKRILNSNLLSDDYCSRAVENASAIWHEKRHFLDLILTNYGAFRFRSFWQIYANLGFTIHFARSCNEIYFPLTTYLNKMKCKLLGISTEGYPEDLFKVAKLIKEYEEMLLEDSVHIKSMTGTNIQIGGDAQLEAIAFLCQFYSVKNKLGEDHAYNLLSKTSSNQVNQDLYLWWKNFFEFIGHQSPAFHWLQREEHIIGMIDNSKALIPILYGALAIRKWNQVKDSGREYDLHPGFASQRLFHIMNALNKGRYDLDGCTTLEAWSLVNDICNNTWGRTAVEEIIADISLEKKRMESIYDETNDILHRALLEYNGLRENFLQLLIKDPEKVLCGEQYANNMLEKLHPIIINSNPFGLLNPRQNGIKEVFGYDDIWNLPEWKQKFIRLKRKYLSPEDNIGWSWAITPTTESWNKSVPDDHYALRDVEAWVEIVKTFAPFAKLSMKGRNHRISLGPELLSLEAQFRMRGVSVKFDPLHEYPSELIRDGKAIFELSCEKQYQCDGCREYVSPKGVEMFSPWTPRKHQLLAHFIIEGRGGGIKGKREFIRDWSPWIMCPDCSKSWKDFICKDQLHSIDEKKFRAWYREQHFHKIRPKLSSTLWTDRLDKKSLLKAIDGQKK